MTISLDRLLKHMSWANQRCISHLQTLPEDCLKAYVTNSDWHVAEIIFHIVDSASAYSNRLTEESEISNLDESLVIKDVNQILDLALLQESALRVDQKLLECMKLDDIEIEFTNYSGKRVKRWRSTILSQAIHHATEHRAQIAAALDAKGFLPLDLDEMDLWSYEIATRQ